MTWLCDDESSPNQKLEALASVILSKNPYREVAEMRSFHQTDSTFAEIMEGKARRRDELTKAVLEADPAVLAESAKRLKEAMRKKDPSQRRRRWDPPALDAISAQG